ncbi:hypothetical protein F2Q68_00010760 [Brassica cretica]|uniref:Secreted protein n=1 Tax=Brassica cretica TaxID=69181 RepID=A0A8S9KRP0_BRACR|nr:hypothetical protein F2Q68_00010760 [Brassica cretica]
MVASSCAYLCWWLWVVSGLPPPSVAPHGVVALPSVGGGSLEHHSSVIRLTLLAGLGALSSLGLLSSLGSGVEASLPSFVSSRRLRLEFLQKSPGMLINLPSTSASKTTEAPATKRVGCFCS